MARNHLPRLTFVAMNWMMTEMTLDDIMTDNDKDMTAAVSMHRPRIRVQRHEIESSQSQRL